MRQIIILSFLLILFHFEVGCQIQLDVKFDIEYIKDSAIVTAEIQNNTGQSIYISQPGFGADLVTDSLLKIDYGYIENITDPMLLPDMKLDLKKIKNGDSWKFRKSKRTNSLKKFYLTFDIVLDENVSDLESRKRLDLGYLLIKEFFYEVNVITFKNTYLIKN